MGTLMENNLADSAHLSRRAFPGDRRRLDGARSGRPDWELRHTGTPPSRRTGRPGLRSERKSPGHGLTGRSVPGLRHRSRLRRTVIRRAAREQASQARPRRMATPPLFVADGRCVVTRSERDVLCWNADDGAAVWSAPREYMARMSPASRDTDAELPPRSVPLLDNAGVALTLSPDGKDLAVGEGRANLGIAQRFEAETGRVLLTLEYRNLVAPIAFSPDSQRVVIGGFTGALDIMDLDDLYAPDEQDVDDLCLRAELLSVQRVHEGGGVTNLTVEEWLGRGRNSGAAGRGPDASPHGAHRVGPDSTEAELRHNAQIFQGSWSSGTVDSGPSIRVPVVF